DGVAGRAEQSTNCPADREIIVYDADHDGSMAPGQADPIRDESPVLALLRAASPADQSQPRDRGAPEITGPASAETLNRGEGPISLEGAWFAKWGRSRAPSSAGRAATPQPLSNPTTNVACRSTAAARRRPSCCLIADPPRSRSSPVLTGSCPSRNAAHASV